MRNKKQTPYFRDKLLIVVDDDENYYLARQKPTGGGEAELRLIDPIWKYLKRARCRSLDDITHIDDYDTVIDNRT